VHWFGVEFHATVVTQTFAKIILLLQCGTVSVFGLMDNRELYVHN